jgi:hypothetical protein
VANCPHADKILGLNEPISRHDFLDGMLVASTAMAVGAACPFGLGAQSQGGPTAGWTGYSGEGDYKGSAGNTEQVVLNAHAVRDGKFDKAPSEVVETGEGYDCVVVGGGQSGLSANPGLSGNGVVAAPGSLDYTSGSFGKITSTRDGQNDQREIQFALKLYF